MTVLVVDDEPQIREVVGLYLQQAGHVVVEAGDGRTAVETYVRVRPDFVILDLMLPDLSGEEVCASIRRRGGGGATVPILMLTAKVGEADKLKGFALGADDYLSKPFSPRELLARVEAIARRSQTQATREGVPTSPELHSPDGRIHLDLEGVSATRDGQSLELTPTEFRLLQMFLNHPGRVHTREQLVSKVLGEDFAGSDRTIDAHIKNLRLKIEDDPRHPRRIQTVFGAGYRGGEV